MTTQKEIDARIQRSRQRRLANPNHPTKLPLPNNIEATDEMKELAMTIVTDHKGLLAIRYLRSPATIAFHTDQHGHKIAGVASGGVIGAIVGMKDLTGLRPDDGVRVGWSKRCMKKDEEDMPVEIMTSTKDRALFAAVLRSLVDSITVKSRSYGESSNGTIIPATVVREMDSFASRVTKYYGKKPINLVFEDVVAVVKEVNA